MQKFFQFSKSLILAVVTVGFVSSVLFVNVSIPEASANPIPVNNVQQDSSTGKALVEYSGVQSTIENYLCTPKGDGTDVFDCINKLYRVGAAVGGMLLVFFIALAGYLYMTGGENGKTKGKELIFSTLTGLAVILGSYVLLNFINPSLVMFRPIQPPIFTASDLPSCEDVGFTQNCILDGGQVYTASTGGPLTIGRWKDLINKYSQQYGLDPCIGDTILRKESSGDPNAIGHDNHSRNQDPPQLSNPPNHGLDFRLPNWSHGIGLTQITIFPEGSRQGGANWPAFPVINGVKTPARRADTIPVKGENSSRWYTIKDLLDPDTSVRLAIGKMAYHMERSNNNLEASFKAYNGGQVYATSAMALYSKCKSGN